MSNFARILHGVKYVQNETLPIFTLTSNLISREGGIRTPGLSVPNAAR